jgi:hypothetical protein
MTMFDGIAWKKSSRSDSQGAQCVEVAITPDVVGVRDSKDREGAVLAFAATDWASFVEGLKAGEFDLR